MKTNMDAIHRVVGLAAVCYFILAALLGPYVLVCLLVSEVSQELSSAVMWIYGTGGSGFLCTVLYVLLSKDNNG